MPGAPRPSPTRARSRSRPGAGRVAAAHGYADGEKLPLDLALENVRRVVSSSELPVTFDIESGYGADAISVGHTTSRAIETGVVGCNIEDSYPESGKLRPVADQVARLRSARAATKRGSIHFSSMRGRTFSSRLRRTSIAAACSQMAIDRANAYADAGADGLFAPGLIDPVLIAELASSTSLPVNIMIGEGSPSIASLAAAGVARVSHGPGPYLSAMTTLATAARSALQYAP